MLNRNMPKEYGKILGYKFGSISWSKHAEWYMTTRECIWKLPKQFHKNALVLSSLLSFGTLTGMTGTTEEKIWIEQLTDGDILLIVEKSIRSAIVYAIHRNA